MLRPESDLKAMKAVSDYLLSHGLSLPEGVTYEYIIDGIYVCVEDYPVLVIGLPPVSNYPVDETEYTDKYLRVTCAIAV